MNDSSVCCGFGGSFAMDYPNVSSAILAKKLDNILATGAGVVVSDNPGCLMQVQGGLASRDEPVRVLHVVELLAERI